jgi:hypothetical protein
LRQRFALQLMKKRKLTHVERCLQPLCATTPTTSLQKCG